MTLSLPDVEASFRAALGRGDAIEFDVGPLDRVGVPVWTLFWAENGAGGAFHAGGIGYGADEQQARVGALGETVERVLAVRTLRGTPVEDGSERQMVRLLGRESVVDPRLLGLPAGTRYSADRPLRWIAVRRLADDEPRWVPAEFVASSGSDIPGGPPPGGWLITPVTNGAGAGLERDRAVAHAIGEIFQRDGNGVVFRALDRGVVVDLDGLTDPDALATLARLRAGGVDALVKLATAEDGMVNVYAVGRAPDDDLIVATACGEAAHPDRDVAIRKALAEFAAARARKAFMHGPLPAVDAVAPAHYLADVLAMVDPAREEQRVLAAMIAWTRMDPASWVPLLEQTVLSRRSSVSYRDLPAPAPDAPAGAAALARHVAAAGSDVLVADFPGEGAHAVKVLCPGLEVETVAYGRMGERNTRRLLDLGPDDGPDDGPGDGSGDGSDGLVRVGPDPGGWSEICLTPQAQERLGGRAWLDRARLDSVVGPLLPLYREPGRHALQLALQERLAAPSR